jgi:flagellum-specific peptidoglycan hydrolase FlgJ
MARGLLPWLPTDLVDEVSNWDFTHKVGSAMSGLSQSASDLMQPIGQQLASLIPDPPPPPPPPPPEPPPTPRFDLGSPDDWGFGSTHPPVTQAAGAFQLPDPSAFLGQAATTVSRAGQSAGQAASSLLPTPAPAPAEGQAAPMAIDRSSPSSFLGSFRQAASRALAEKGYPQSLAPILAAIPMNEQGWQKEAPGNNYYGIKGSNPRTGANTGPVGTWEDYGGGRTNIQDTFRAYSGPAESVADFLSFLEDNPRYGKAVQIARETGDPAQFIKAVHAAGYATDPSWSDKILSIAGQVPNLPAAAVETGRAAVQAAGGAIARAAGAVSGASRLEAYRAGGLDTAGIEAAYKGVPYTYGGPGGRTNAALGVPTDCSGFVSAVWQDQYGVPLVAHTDGAYNQLKGLGAQEIANKDARPGDVVFYLGAGTGGSIAHHMGVYAGDGKVLDMSVSGGDGVKERPVAHGGEYVILRDPRLGGTTPRSADEPPPIVETGVAELSGGRRPTQTQIDAASQAASIVAPLSYQASRDPISQPWNLPFDALGASASGIGSAARSLVAPPSAPSPFAPAGTPGVYVEPEEDRIARGQAILAPGRAAVEWAQGETTTAVPEAGGRRVPGTVLGTTELGPEPAPAPGSFSEAMAPAVERARRLALEPGFNPLEIAPAAEATGLPGQAVGRAAVWAGGGGAEPTITGTVPEAVPFVGGTPYAFSPQDVGGTIGEAALDPTNFVGVPAAVRGGQRLLPAVARALPGVDILEALGRGGAGLVRRAATGVGEALSTPPVAAGPIVELGGGFVPRTPRPEGLVRPSGVVEGAAMGTRGAVAGEYATGLEQAGAPASSVKRFRALEHADLANEDELVREMEVFPFTSAEATREMLGDRPEYLDAVVRFGLEQRKKLLDGRMNERDVAKAYGMTLMSMRSAAQDAAALQEKYGRGFVTGAGEAVPPNPQLARLDGLVSPHTGEPLGDIFTETGPGGRPIVRPESAGAAWFWTDEGQRAINAIEEGEFIPEAWDDLRKARAAFGSDTVGGNGALRPLTPAEVARGEANLTNLSGWTAEMNEGIARLRAAGREDEIGPWLTDHAKKLKGIGVGKSAFIKQLLGMGDAATIDAREINYWLSGTGLLSPSDTHRGAQLARAASQWWGSEPRVAQALAPRIQAAIADLGTRYPELVEGVHPEAAGGFLHHWIWDKSGRSTTAHRDLMATQRLAAGAAPSLSPGLKAAAYNAAQGGAVGAASEELQAIQEDRETDPAEMARRALVGAGLGVGAGIVARRGGAGRVARSLGSGQLEMSSSAGRGAEAIPSATISPVGRRVMETYRAVTPARVEASTARTIEIASDAISSRAPKAGGLQPEMSAALVADVHDAIVRNLEQSKVVMTGIRPGAVRAYLRGEGLTSKVDTRDLAKINEITQGQVNVAGGRAGKPYTLEQAADFAQRESEQMRAAVGGTRFPDAETGAVDEAAPRVMYAYVSEGQPLVGPNRPTMWLTWDETTPRITSAHHPYGLLSPGQDIHASMPPGLKAAIWDEAAVKGGRAAPAVMEGGRLVEAAPDVTEGVSPLVTGWERQGLDVGEGRRIADTHWLVGPEGEDAMRANGLILGMPQEVQRAIARGELTDPEQIAAALMRGGSPKWKPGWAAVTNPSRSESLIVDPAIENVKAIYFTGVPKDLEATVPNTGGMTTLEVARRMRADILKATNGEKDVPIYFTDISQSAKAGSGRVVATPMADAQLLEGTPLPGGLSPGRQDIVDAYTGTINPKTREPYTNIGSGFVPDPFGMVPDVDPDEVADLARRAAETPMTRPHTEGEHVVRNVARQVEKQAASGVPRDIPEGPMPPPDPPPKWYDWANAWRYGWGLFAQLSTAAVQAIGPVADLALGIPTEIVERGLLKGQPGELGPILGAGLRAIPEGLASAARTARGEVNPRLQAGSDYRPSLEQRYRARGETGRARAANVVEAPGRIATQSPDAFWYEVFYNTGLRSAAADEARATGARAADLMANPTDAMIDRAHEIAQEATYKGELGALAKVPEKLMRSGPEGYQAIMSHLMPVYHTVARIHEEALPYVPGVGALPLERLGLRAKGRPASRVVAQQAVGAALVGEAMAYAAAGGIRGPGPEDPNEAQAMRDLGYVENTINIGGYWVPTSWLGKAGPIINEVAALNDAMLYDRAGKRWADATWEQKVNRLIHNSARAVRDYPALEAVSTVGGFFGDPTGTLASFLGETAGQYIPGPYRTYAAWNDPNARTRDRGESVPFLRQVEQTARQRSGVGREELPKAQDILGRDVENPRQGPAALLPRVGTDRQDPVLQAFLDADLNIGDPPKELTVPGLKDPDLKPALTPEEQRRWNTLRGEAIIRTVGPAIADPGFAQATPSSRQAFLEKRRTAAAEEAHARLRSEIGAQEINRRISERQGRKAS